MTHSRRLFAAALAAVLFIGSFARASAQAETPAAPAAPAPAPAQPAEPATGPAAEFKALFNRISEKLQTGEQTEAALAAELKEFDALIDKYAKDQPNDAAMIAVMKSRLYLEVFQQDAKAVEILKATQTRFATSDIAARLPELIKGLEDKIAADARLAVGQPFPAFSEKDLDGKPLTTDAYKGKVVLVDFWATWCGPCVAELPNVLAAYQKYHDKGFEIIGISLDKDRDALTKFIAENKMTWAQYFDGQGWENKLSQAYGITSIPATFLLDREGKIAAKDLRGPELEAKLAELLK